MDNGPDNLERRTSERIAAVRERFAAALPGRAAALSALAREAGGDDRARARAAADDLRLGLHNLAGGAPTLGLAPLGEAAATLEKRLAAGRSSDGGLEHDLAHELADAVDGLSGIR